MKTLARYVLAATLAVTVYSFSNGGSGNTAVLDDPSDLLKIVRVGHEYFGQEMTRGEIEADLENICPGDGQVCAAPTPSNPLVTPIEWGGPSVKF